jgi:CBS-domain-containing membrane protein
LATGLPGAAFNALRAVAGGGALARADGFDFATVFAAVFSAIFLDFATALAMASNYPKKGEKMRALHHFERFRASRETLVSRATCETS